MSQEITEKDYPIEKSWIFKSLNPFNIVISFITMVGLFIYWILSFNKTDLVLSDVMGQFSKEGVTILILAVAFVAVISLINNFIVPFIRAYLWYTNFHYFFKERELVVTQGILSKVERLIPYETLQDVSLSQDFWDRLFGTATLRIQNVGSMGMAANPLQNILNRRSTTMVSLGSFGGAVIFGSLKKENAEKLKEIVLQKIKENPARIESGL